MDLTAKLDLNALKHMGRTRYISDSEFHAIVDMAVYSTIPDYYPPMLKEGLIEQGREAAILALMIAERT